MKVLITSFNQRLGVNPMVGRMLDAIPGVTRAPVEDCEVIFLLFIAPECDFVLDADLLDRAKKRDVPVIVFDYTETFPAQFILGDSDIAVKVWLLKSPYAPLFDFVHASKVKAYFKRELLTGRALPQTSYPVFPVDWTIADQPQPHIDTPEEFNARPIDIFYCWGYSNESRPKLMGELLKQAGRFSAHFCLTPEDIARALEEKRQRIFALLFVPHYRRIPITEILWWQDRTKVSISMFGAGRKCFRNAESSYNCVMAQQAPGSVEWSYPWTQENSVRLAECNEVQAVEDLFYWLRMDQGRLHPTYLKGMENNRRYHNTAYARDYLLPKIQEALR